MDEDDEDGMFVEAMMRSTMEGGPMRVAIVCDDDGAWYVRRVRMVEHDLNLDEKVYHCDLPIGSRFETLDDAVTRAKIAIQRS